MFSKHGTLVILLLLLTFADLGTQQEFNNNLLDSDVLQKIALGSEKFSLDLFKRISIAVAEKDYDFMISPFSIWSLLLFIAEGAQNNTLTQLVNALRLNSNFASIRQGYKQIQSSLKVNTSTVEVSNVNILFPDKNFPIKTPYANILKSVYETNVVPVNYSIPQIAVQQINNLVEKVTRGLIDSVVYEDDLKSAKLILISALYFRGQWKFPFNKTLTKEENFYDENGAVTSKVQMMFQRGNFPYAGIKKLESYVLELPYGKEDRLAMLIILPEIGSSLTSVVSKLADITIAEIYSHLQKMKDDFEDEEVEVHLPQFKTTSDFVLNIILQQMGITDVFDAEKANLSLISNDSVYLSRILHKTIIEVNEEGTIAAGFTSGVLANKASPSRFYINRPFAYVIIEKTTNSLVFCGQVRKPT